MTHVVPGIKQHYSPDESNKLAEALSFPVLFAAFQSGLENMLSQDVYKQEFAKRTNSFVLLISTLIGIQSSKSL